MRVDVRRIDILYEINTTKTGQNSIFFVFLRLTDTLYDF